MYLIFSRSNYLSIERSSDDGKVVVATDVVTGKPDGEHDTPQGTYKLKYKIK